jgi:hypothetical protein
LIDDRLKIADRSKTWLAKQVHCSPSSFCKLLRKSHIDTELLILISQVLKYDFFAHYTAFLCEDRNVE